MKQGALSSQTLQKVLGRGGCLLLLWAGAGCSELYRRGDLPCWGVGSGQQSFSIAQAL